MAENENIGTEPQSEAAEADTQAKKEQKTKKKSEADALRDSVAELESELSQAQDKYLRLAAEYDNYRKRTQKEREGVYTDAVADTVEELLPILDNLERAAMYKDAERVAQGLEMIFKSTDAALSKLGVTAFGVAGEQFDPNLHNAVMHTEDDSLGENEIVEVLQRGYKRGDKIIRYAMVKVAN